MTDTNENLPQKQTRRAALFQTLGMLTAAVRDADQDEIESAIAQLGKSRRLYAPLGFLAGAFALLFDGLKLLVLNWRLTLIEIVPAVWIWVTFWNLKAHFLKGRELAYIHGWVALMFAIGVMGLTIAAYYCNAIFAFAVAGEKPPKIRPAAVQARAHLRVILTWGAVVGFAHAATSVYIARIGKGWFILSMGAVLVVMTVTFVSVPAQFIGAVKEKLPLTQRARGAAASGAMSAVLTSPGFLLNRIGLLVYGIRSVRIVGLVLFSIGIALEAAATSGAKAVKLGSVWGAITSPDPPTATPDVDLQDEGHPSHGV